MKIALIGEDFETKGKIREYFAKNNEFEFVVDEEDGFSALRAIEEKGVDVVITQLMLSQMHAFDLMEHFKERKGPKFIVLSELKSEAFLMKCLAAGAAAFLLAPVNLVVLEEKLKNVTNSYVKSPAPFPNRGDRSGKSLDEKISNIFINVGIPAHIKGYQFLRDGVKLVVESPEKINSITRGLYPEIAERFATTPSKVERAIRHAIEVAWSRGRIENINNIFGAKVYTANEKPTNGEFIALIADKMLLEAN